MTERRDFHQDYGGDEDVRPPSARSTGLVFAAVAFMVAAVGRESPALLWGALTAGFLLAAISFAQPGWLEPLNRLWFRFGLLLHKVVNPVVMGAIFFLVFVPAGALMRLRYDPLRRRRGDAPASYWVERTVADAGAGRMERQF